MDKGGEDDVLVATTKPKRGREMITTAIPMNVFARKSTVETYHEGFVDGKKVYVPDSNLEAMKDMINLTMRQRKSTRFRHQTSADMGDEMTVERLDKILAKLREMRLSDSTQASQSLSKGSYMSKENRDSELESHWSSLWEKNMSERSYLSKRQRKSEPKNTRQKSESQGSSRPTEKSESESESERSSWRGENMSQRSLSKRESKSEPKNTRQKNESQVSFRPKEKSQSELESEWSLLREENISTLSSERSSLSKKERMSEQNNTDRPKSGLQRLSRSKEENEPDSRSRWSLKEEDISKLESERSSWSKKDREFISIDTTRPEVGIQRSSLLIDESTEEESEETDKCHLRLLLSGHFKNNENPIYIIQELKKSVTVFNKESADFTSSQNHGNAHVFITGKLFKENVLEESEGKPTCLNIKPYKILIDPNKTKIFRNYFESTYNKKATDITIKGEFLRNGRSMDITPFLSLNFKQSYFKKGLNSEKNMKSEEKRTSILNKNLEKNSSNSALSKGMKRVSFRESSDEEIHFYDMKKKRTSASYSGNQEKQIKREVFDSNTTFKSTKKYKENPMEGIEKKNEEGIFFFITQNKWFQNMFSKTGKDK